MSEVGSCSRCARECSTQELQRVSLWLQLLAFPITALFVLRNLASVGFAVKTLTRDRDKRIKFTEYGDLYCRNCIGKQVISHWIVGLWAVTLVGYLIYKNVFA
jgi:hypothetical protein